MTSVLKVASIPDRSDHGGRSFWAHASDFGYALAGLIGFEDGVDLLIKVANPRVNLEHELVKGGNALSRERVSDRIHFIISMA